MLRNWENTGGVGVGGISPIFNLPLNDAGAGVVNTAPISSGGSATATFTRATTAYARLSNGLFGLVSSGQPRSHYSAAGVYLGYLAEGARANLVGGTNALVRDMSSASWVATNITKGTTTGIDGTAAAAATLTASAGNGTVLYTPGLGAADRTYSFWAKRVTGNGTIQITEDGSTFTTITVTDTVNWTQFSIDSGSLVPIVGFKIVTSGDAIAVDFNMLEAATFANPTPIPVGVSKAADLLTYVTSGNLSSTVGTCYAEFTSATPASGGGGSIISTYNGGTEGAPMTINNGTAKLALYDGTATRDLSAAISRPITTILKGTTAWSGSTCSGTLSGAAVTGVTFDGNMGLDTAFAIGSDRVAGGAMFGATKNIKAWGVLLPIATQQALTT